MEPFWFALLLGCRKLQFGFSNFIFFHYLVIIILHFLHFIPQLYLYLSCIQFKYRSNFFFLFFFFSFCIDGCASKTISLGKRKNLHWQGKVPRWPAWFSNLAHKTPLCGEGGSGGRFNPPPSRSYYKLFGIEAFCLFLHGFYQPSHFVPISFTAQAS